MDSAVARADQQMAGRHTALWLGRREGLGGRVRD